MVRRAEGVTVANRKTLSACVQELRPLEQQKVKVWTVDPETGEESEQLAPAFLFRGEATLEWHTTFSTMYRFERDETLTEAERNGIIAATRLLDQALRSFGLHPMYSASLLQHYGLPTEVIDATASVDIAASFATYKNGGEPGRIYVYDVMALRQHAIVIDLKRIHFARRPRLQVGYCLFHRTEPDFKAKHLLETIGARSYEFQGSAEEIATFDKNAELWGDPRKDPVSGLLNKIYHDVVLPQLGLGTSHKDSITSWVEKRIPWAVVPMKVIEEKGERYAEPDWDRF